MRRYRFPLLVREVGIARRTLGAATALLSVALLALYATFDPANRYRLLADPPMARSLLLPAALLIGGLCAWQSFVSEMRSGTWDGWLLLPRSRGALVMSKVGVGLASITLALLGPVATLWLVMRLAGGLGGPLVGPVDLLVRSSFSQALVVAWSTYLAVANAALLARDGQIAFLAPLLLPLVATARFFVGQDGFNGLSPRVVTLGWLAASILMLALLIVSLLRSGRPSSGLEAGLRAMLLTPAAGLAVLVVGLIGYESKGRIFPERRESREEAEPRAAKPYLRQDGVIRSDAAERRTAASMYSLRSETGDSSRLHVPLLANRRMQIFQHESLPLLRAFDVASGESIGCVGTNGLRACEEATNFDSEPSAYFLGAGDGGALLTERAVYLLRPDGQVELLLEGGPVTDAVSMSDGIAIIAGGDLYQLQGRGAQHRAGEQAASAEAPQRPALALRCRALAPPGKRVAQLVIVNHPAVLTNDSNAPPPRPFSGAVVVDAADASRAELVVCHDGEVSERVPTLETQPRASVGRFGRGDAQSLFVGPLVDIGVHALSTDRTDEALSWPARRAATLSVALIVTALGCALVGLRRKTFPWWVLPGVVFGPGYVLACVLLLIRRPRWAGLVSGLG